MIGVIVEFTISILPDKDKSEEQTKSLLSLLLIIGGMFVIVNFVVPSRSPRFVKGSDLILRMNVTANIIIFLWKILIDTNIDFSKVYLKPYGQKSV